MKYLSIALLFALSTSALSAQVVLTSDAAFTNLPVNVVISAESRVGTNSGDTNLQNLHLPPYNVVSQQTNPLNSGTVYGFELNASGGIVTYTVFGSGPGSTDSVVVYGDDPSETLGTFSQLAIRMGRIPAGINSQSSVSNMILEGNAIAGLSRSMGDGPLYNIYDINEDFTLTGDIRFDWSQFRGSVPSVQFKLLETVIIPEPSTLAACAGLGLIGLVLLRRRRRA